MPGLISDQLISNLRTTAYKQLVTPAKIHRRVKSEGPFGTASSDVVVSETLTWFKPAFKGNLALQPGGGIQNDSGAEFRFRFDEDIRVGDQIEVNGETNYLVQDVNSGATIQLYLKVWTERIE